MASELNPKNPVFNFTYFRALGKLEVLKGITLKNILIFKQSHLNVNVRKFIFKNGSFKDLFNGSTEI